MRFLICLRDRKAWDRAARRLRLPAGAQVWIAPLTEDESLVESASVFASTFSCAVHVLRTRTGYREICMRAREKLMAFTAKWPEQVQWRGRNFRELFVHNGDLSWWWLAELSQRNCEDRPTFGWMCELELLRDVVAGKSFDEAVVCVDDVDIYAIMRTLLLGCTNRVVPNRARRRWLGANRIFLVWLMRWRDFWGELSHTLAMRWACRGRARRPEKPAQPRVVWHTWYPAQWLETNGRAEDRYYLHIPRLAETTGRFRNAYLATVRGPITPWAVVRAVRQRLCEKDFEWVQRYARIRDLVRAYFNFWPVFRYWVLETFSRRYRDSFHVDGEDLFPILRHDMHFSYLRNIPRLLATAEQFRRYAEVHKPEVLVTYLEMYCYGRAVIYGVKRGSPNTRVIGYQHSAITPLKLVYNYAHGQLRMRNGAGNPLAFMPLPDRFVVHGPAAKRIAEAGGYPGSRIDVAGAARLDYLHRRLKEPSAHRLGVPDGCRVVLVASPIWPDRTRSLLEIAMRGLRNRDGVFTIFRLHPLDRLREQRVHDLAAKHGFRNYSVAKADLYTLIRAAEVLFTMSSTTGAEALAMGVPAIHLQRARDLDLSPFFEFPDAAIQVSSVEEFGRALELILQRGPALADLRKKWAEVISETFYTVDGKAGERFVEVLSREIFGALNSAVRTGDGEVLQPTGTWR